MISDHNSSYFRRVQANASIVGLPLQYLANWPVEFFEWLGASISTQHQVLEENARLRAEHLLLQAKLQRLVAIQNENSQLRALLQSSPHVGGQFTVAQLLAVNMDPFVQKVILDKGANDKIYTGQPVLDAYGVMGQVVEANPVTSEVLLVTDPQSAISVQDGRNGVRAIAAGTGNGLQLVNVPDTTDIQEGDLMVTSGLDQRFPQGYPMGVVKKVQRDPELRFATIDLEPSAHIDRSRMVLLVWPNLNNNQQATTTTNSSDNKSKVNSNNTSIKQNPSETAQTQTQATTASASTASPQAPQQKSSATGTQSNE